MAAVGRTLLSAAFDVVFDLDFRCMADDSKSSRGQTQVTNQNKANFKSVGQECPTHTQQKRLLVDVLLGFQALGESL